MSRLRRAAGVWPVTSAVFQFRSVSSHSQRPEDGFEDSQLAGVCVDRISGRILVANTSYDRIEVLVPASLQTMGELTSTLSAVLPIFEDDPSSRNLAAAKPVSKVLPQAPIVSPPPPPPPAPATAPAAASSSSSAATTPITLDLSHVHNGRKKKDSDGSSSSSSSKDEALFCDVYPPSMPDTLLFLKVLEQEASYLQALKPSVCVEVGCGAAPLAACLSKLLGQSTTASLATDVSLSAMHAAKETSRRNDTPLHLARMDLVSALRPGTIDVLTCHPPYVPTSSEQLDAAHAKAAVTSSSTECMEDAAWTWAGGPNGRAVFDRMIDALPSALSANGVAYVLFFEEAAFDQARLEAMGLQCRRLAEYSENGEAFVIMKIERLPVAVD